MSPRMFPARGPTVPERTDPPAAAAAPTRSVRIPEEVAATLEQRMRGSSFSSLDEFVTFVLARVAESPSEMPFSEEEEKRLKERLRSLGYID
jgi:hypothetical protein